MQRTLEALLQRLVVKGAARARGTPIAKPDERFATSVRLKASTKHFLECQAEALSTSMQAVIDMILEGVADSTLDRPSRTLQSIRERFFFLLEAHHIDLPDAAALLSPLGFTLSALTDTSRLLDLLTPQALEFLADLFLVRKDWLSGKSDRAADDGFEWYKNHVGALRQLLAWDREGLRPHVQFVRRVRADFAGAFKDNDARGEPIEQVGVVVRLTRSPPDVAPFEVYASCEFQRWNYWRCRYHYKSLICACERARIPYDGLELPTEAISALREHLTLPASVLNGSHHRSAWYPEDYASFRWDVEEEASEWPTIRTGYEDDRIDEIIEAFPLWPHQLPAKTAEVSGAKRSEP